MRGGFILNRQCPNIFERLLTKALYVDVFIKITTTSMFPSIYKRFMRIYFQKESQ